MTDTKRPDGLPVPNRPRIRKASSRADYESWVEEYIEARSAADTCYPHHEESYDLVLECPLCGGLARIDPPSVGEDPWWSCMTSIVPGHSIHIDGGELVAQSHRTGQVRSEPIPDGWDL